MKKASLYMLALAVGAVWPLAAAGPVLADSGSPLAVTLSRFSIEIDGVTIGGVHTQVPTELADEDATESDQGSEGQLLPFEQISFHF